jgi:hypothetical protein
MNPVGNVLFGIASAALLASAQAHAGATVVYMKGGVRDDGAPVTLGQRILPGTTVTTGPSALATLRFSDQQKIVLGEDTALKIADFHYVANEPRRDHATFDLVRGAVRFISGVIGARSPGVVALRCPQATFSVHGTDFMVALPNWAYLKVLKGAVGVTNLGGTVVFGENTSAAISSKSTLAQPVFTAALPTAASGAFSSLAVLPTEATVTPAAASGSAGADTAAVRAPMIDVRGAFKLGILAALIGAALSGSSATTHH